ncbi:flagellin N-terminal helical domain-containing protein [Histidinibacterium aquaticum]|uniref:Flagellin n=1 Tax=Histidinibacterium aquaticum TaxID=2613962 RepID=A0A5J5GQW6_9RHOB|nr:flagellin [Histidinibacterium aquaticum]KAA9009964.1 flagellar protein [Histidinibacterium aquaticum]
MSSILTNNSAMNALSTLRNINNNLSQTQDRISTGLKVDSAKDNASYFSISTTMSAESGMNKAVNEGLTLAKNSISTARLGAETVKDLAQQFMERAAFAQETGVDQAEVQKELVALTDQMLTAISQSSFNGENLISTAGVTAQATKDVTTGVSRAGGTISTTTQSFTNTDLEAVAGNFATIAGNIGGATTQAALEAELVAAEAELQTVIGAATNLGVAEKAIETQQNFLNELSDRLDAGVGSMVDANMEEEAARLQALQVQQQLATQSLSMANQAPQNILSLFR